MHNEVKCCETHIGANEDATKLGQFMHHEVYGQRTRSWMRLQNYTRVGPLANTRNRVGPRGDPQMAISFDSDPQMATPPWGVIGLYGGKLKEKKIGWRLH
jgi:hypothetical protein